MSQPDEHLEVSMAELEGVGIGEGGGGSEAAQDLEADRGPARWRWVVTGAVVLVGLLLLAAPVAWALGLFVALAPLWASVPLLWLSLLLLVVPVLSLASLVAYWCLARAS